MIVAVATGALAAAGQALQAGAVEVTTPSAQPAQLAALAMDVEPALRALPPAAPELLLLPRPATGEVEALGKAVHRAEHSYTRPGVPYVAGNDEDLDGWIAKALGLMGLPQSLAPGVKEVIMNESGGDPDAVNRHDSNAAAGYPSEGLMQVIPVVFEACVLPELADRSITDPVANITAGVRAMIANHGIETLMNGGRRDSSGNYIGYGGAKVPGDELPDDAVEFLEDVDS